MNIGTRIGIVSGESIINNLKIHYDVSNVSNLYSDVDKTTNPVLDGGASTGVIKSFKNLASSSSRDSIQSGATDVLYQTINTKTGAYFNSDSYHVIPNISNIKDIINMTFIFVLQYESGLRLLTNKKNTGTSGSVSFSGSNNITMVLRTDDNILTVLQSTLTSAVGSRFIAVYRLDTFNNNMRIWNNLHDDQRTFTGTLTPGKGEEILLCHPSTIGGTDAFKGHVFEFKIINRLLTDVEVRNQISELALKWDITLQTEGTYISNGLSDPEFTKLNDGVIANFDSPSSVWTNWNIVNPIVHVYTFLTNITSIVFHMTKNSPFGVELPTNISVNGSNNTFTDTVQTSGDRQLVAREINPPFNVGKNTFSFTMQSGKQLFMSEFVINTS